MTPRVLVVGAGWSGAVFARAVAERAGVPTLVIEARAHPAGNCHTERDAETGVMQHVYGPHIFHTSERRVWEYVQRFGTFRPYAHRVKAMTHRGVFGLPINLHTLNQFFGLRMVPAEAEAFLRGRAVVLPHPPRNFEEQALSMVGPELYEAFLKGYTTKQWGCDPVELPASVLTRLPVRFSYDDRYHHSTYSAIPEEGYSAVIARVLDHPLITVQLDTPWEPAMAAQASHVIFTGALDEFFGWAHGRLSYRTVRWDVERGTGDLQGVTQINYPDVTEPWTRTIEPKHFTPWESHTRSIQFTEYSFETGPADTPYYPKRLSADMSRLALYRRLARTQPRMSFLGRLATYRYLDMERVIDEALTFADAFLVARQADAQPPTFPNVEKSD